MTAQDPRLVGRIVPRVASSTCAIANDVAVAFVRATGPTDARAPCMEPRHHRTTHITLHGSFEPVGGYLRDEEKP